MDISIEQKKGWRKFFSKKYIPHFVGAIIIAIIIYAVVKTDTNATTASNENFKVVKLLFVLFLFPLPLPFCCKGICCS